MTYPHPERRQYRIRKWYSVELADSRDMAEIRAWLKLGMDKVESRHGVTVERRRVYKEKSRTGSSNYYWLMEGESREWQGE